MVERLWGGDLTAQTLVVYRDAKCIHLANTALCATTGAKALLASKVAVLKSEALSTKVLMGQRRRKSVSRRKAADDLKQALKAEFLQNFQWIIDEKFTFLNVSFVSEQDDKSVDGCDVLSPLLSRRSFSWSVGCVWADYYTDEYLV